MIEMLKQRALMNARRLGFTMSSDDETRLPPSLGIFDLVFADAQGGKWTRLNLTIAAIKAGGNLLLDDMAKFEDGDPEVHAMLDTIRGTLSQHPGLVCREMAWATGMVLCAKRVSE